MYNIYIYTCACACVHPLYIRIYFSNIYTNVHVSSAFCYPPWGSFGFLFIAHWLRSSPVGGDHFFHDVEYHSYTISTIISTINGLISGKNYSKACHGKIDAFRWNHTGRHTTCRPPWTWPRSVASLGCWKPPPRGRLETAKTASASRLRALWNTKEEDLMVG